LQKVLEGYFFDSHCSFRQYMMYDDSLRLLRKTALKTDTITPAISPITELLFFFMSYCGSVGEYYLFKTTYSETGFCFSFSFLPMSVYTLPGHKQNQISPSGILLAPKPIPGDGIFRPTSKEIREMVIKFRFTHDFVFTCSRRHYPRLRCANKSLTGKTSPQTLPRLHSRVRTGKGKLPRHTPTTSSPALARFKCLRHMGVVFSFRSSF